MTTGKYTQKVKDLAGDNSFVLWCLSPDEVLEHVWSEYLLQHPEEKETVQQAKEIVCSVRLNSHRLSAMDKAVLRKRILQDWECRKLAKRKRLFWQYSAACIALLCMCTGLFLVQKNVPPPCLASYEIQIDSMQTEIELLLTNNKQIRIVDNASIKINEKGEALIENNEITSITNGAVKQFVGKKTAGLEMNILKVPEGRRSSILLADGTKIWVNSGTILRFPDQFDKDSRTIYVNGEIYLEVAKNPSCPFYVKTSKMDVQVLGTSFNVTAYDEDAIQSVVLKEGSVSVDNYSGIKNLLKPNEKLTLENNQVTISEVDIDDYMSWTEGYLQFNQRDLTEILTRLSRHYRVHFEYPLEISEMKCSGKLVLFENIEPVLRTLQTSFSLSYTISGNIVTLKVRPSK